MSSRKTEKDRLSEAALLIDFMKEQAIFNPEDEHFQCDDLLGVMNLVIESIFPGRGLRVTVFPDH